MKNKNLKNILAGIIGNAVEWYDFALFGAFSSTISQLFFPTDDPQIALLKTYGIFAAGFIMRPLGSIVLGYVGDKKGRKNSLILSIYLMTFPTICIGLLPTYEQIGAWAPLLLTLIRLMQGFSMGGEYGGSMVFLFEHAPLNRKGFYSSWVDVGCLAGVLLGTLISWATVTFLSHADYLSWGWRFPFIGSLALTVMILYFRHRIEETDIFMESTPKMAMPPTVQTSREFLSKTFSAMFVYAFGNVCFYIFLVFVPNYFIQQNAVYSSHSLLVTSFMSASIALAIPYGGYLSDTYGRRRTLCLSIIAAILIAYPLFLTMITSAFYINLFFQIVFALALAAFYGGEAAFIAETFPPHTRCRGVSLVLSFANILFGGGAPFFAAWLVQEFNNTTLVATIVIFTGILALWGLSKTSLKKVEASSLKYA